MMIITHCKGKIKSVIPSYIETFVERSNRLFCGDLNHIKETSLTGQVDF